MKKHLFYAAILVAVFLFTNNKLYAQKSGLETAGDIGVFIVPASALTYSLIKGDTKGTWQFTKGLLLAQVVTFGLKLSIDKERPDFSNKNSFPSGHTSTTFQGAAFMHQRYGFKYSIPAYAIATFTAFSRIHEKKHDGWDVLAGAIIGVGSSYLFTTPYQQEHLSLNFNSAKGNYQLGLVYKF